MEGGMMRRITEKTGASEINRTAGVCSRAEERMSIEAMLPDCTINGAGQTGFETFRDSIKVGKDADFLVFGNDLLTVEHGIFSFNRPGNVYFCGRKVNLCYSQGAVCRSLNCPVF